MANNSDISSGLSGAIKEAVSDQKELLSVTEALKDGLASAAKAAESFGKSFINTLEKMPVIGSLVKSFKGLSSMIRHVPEKLASMYKQLEKLPYFGKVFTLIAFPLRAYIGLLKSIPAILSGIYKSFNVLYDIPFRVFGVFIAKVNALKEEMRQLGQAVEDVRENFGNLNRTAGEAVVTGMKSATTSMKDFGIGFYQVFQNSIDNYN
jgi:hypothetical protein